MLFISALRKYLVSGSSTVAQPEYLPLGMPNQISECFGSRPASTAYPVSWYCVHWESADEGLNESLPRTWETGGTALSFNLARE